MKTSYGLSWNIVYSDKGGTNVVVVLHPETVSVSHFLKENQLEHPKLIAFLL
jgi:hypothetical protein